MSAPPWTHSKRVRVLYKMVLRLHRSLPAAMKELGDIYVKDEFRRHKKCNPVEANTFLNEWAEYAINLSEQLGLRGPQMAKPLGTPLKTSDLEKLRDEQIQQLYELMLAATDKTKEEEKKLDNK